VSFFPGFRGARLPGAGAAIHAVIGGEGPPLLLLHGFPQTHVAWRHVAPRLARRFTVVAADLRGYGASDAPPDDPAHETYAKRAMAADMVEAMASLGHDRFAVAGHDRGGRVAYRLALDRPDVVTRLAVLEIAPTAHYWRAFAAMGVKAYHWAFLAQPAPLPEHLIGGDPVFFLEWTLRGWTRDRSLAPFEDGALDAYRAALTRADRVAAYCADYRAGAGPDRDHDEADLAAGRTIACPVLLMCGTRGFPAASGDPAAHWRDFAPDLRTATADCGHFPAEEDPETTAAALETFFAEGA
jgi:haloacetate dehalogenase